MHYEDAYYFMMLFRLGYDEGYAQWLDGMLENESPLSDLALQLSFCGDDKKKIYKILFDYCRDNPVDEKIVRDKIRNGLKELYSAKKITVREAVSFMYTFFMARTEIIGKFDPTGWETMYCLEDYCDLADIGIVTQEDAVTVFEDYLFRDIEVCDNPVYKRRYKGYDTEVDSNS